MIAEDLATSTRVAVLYATREGQTRRIAEHIAAALRARHVQVDVVDVRHLPSGFTLDRHTAVIVAASVHAGKHEPEMVAFVRRNLASLARLPSAFLSVSGAEATVERAGATDEQRATATTNVRRAIDRFLADTGWTPAHVEPVAGAVAYSKYGWLMRVVLKAIMKREGGPTDTSRDWDFTDRAALDRFVAAFPEAPASTRAR